MIVALVRFTSQHNIARATQNLYRGQGIALFVSASFMLATVARSPSAEDGVQLISASLSCGDFYRDALGEIAQIHTFTDTNNTLKVNDGCKLRAS